MRLVASISDSSITVIISSSDNGAAVAPDDTIDGTYPNFHVLLLSSLYQT